MYKEFQEKKEFKALVDAAETRKQGQNVNLTSLGPWSTLKEIKRVLMAYPHLMSRKNKYSAEQLMMLLDNDRLAALEDEFNEHPLGIEMANFVWLMECAINYPPEEKVDLVYGLVRLFKDIDINGDYHMEWHEFTQYVIDCVLEDGAFTSKIGDKTAADVTEVEVMEQLGSSKTKKYQISEIPDALMQSFPIKRMVASGRDDIFFMLEENSGRIKAYNRRLEVVNQVETKKQSIYEQKGAIKDFDYDQENDIIGFVTTDKKMYFYEGTKRMSLLHIAEKFKRVYNGIWYLPQTQLWLTSSVDNFLTIWKIHKTGLVFLSEVTNFKAHTQIVTDCVEITASNLIATASLDGLIRIWGADDFRLRTELEDFEDKKNKTRQEDEENRERENRDSYTSGSPSRASFKRRPQSTNPTAIIEGVLPSRCITGVRSISYTSEHGGFLISTGYHSYINVWSPDASLSKSFVGRLEGHSGIVIVAKVFPNSPICISVDDKSNIKIWDLRNLTAIQTIRNEA